MLILCHLLANILLIPFINSNRFTPKIFWYKDIAIYCVSKSGKTHINYMQGYKVKHTLLFGTRKMIILWQLLANILLIHFISSDNFTPKIFWYKYIAIYCVSKSGKTHINKTQGYKVWSKSLCAPDTVYLNNPRKNGDLKMAITGYIRNVDSVILNTVLENTFRCTNRCLENGVGDFEHDL